MFRDRLYPIAIAHRAANDLETLANAESREIDVIEGDVWLHQKRLEIRHQKSAWSAPLLWDRWSIQKGWGPRLTLQDLFRAADGSTPLMLDLKGWNRELPDRVLAAINAEKVPRDLAVCAQTWSFVDRFKSFPDVTRVYSIGSHRMLRQFVTSSVSADAPAISINAKLLDADVARVLGAPGRTILAWNVPTFERAEQLLSMGIRGIISEDFDLLEKLKTLPIDSD